MRKFLARIFPRRYAPRLRNDCAARVEWAALKMGDKLIPKTDIHVKSHRRWFKAYPSHRQFTQGKAYPVMQTRIRTGVVFVRDDAGFHVDLDQWRGRHFDVQRLTLQ